MQLDEIIIAVVALVCLQGFHHFLEVLRIHALSWVLSQIIKFRPDHIACFHHLISQRVNPTIVICNTHLTNHFYDGSLGRYFDKCFVVSVRVFH